MEVNAIDRCLCRILVCLIFVGINTMHGSQVQRVETDLNGLESAPFGGQRLFYDVGDTLEDVIKALKHENPLVRFTAAHTIGKQGQNATTAVEPLAEW